jgi:hypothetical protein
MRLGICLALAWGLSACHSAGPYGHSRTYTPLSDEGSAVARAKQYDPVMVSRMPEKWNGKSVWLFGVVKSRVQGPGGAADLTLGVHTLEPRNLCESGDEDSCRVTVSEREHGIVHALVKLSGDDDVGKLSVGTGSLLRVVGPITDRVNENDGSPVVRATYYRHWPRGYYVTTADRSHMKR